MSLLKKVSKIVVGVTMASLLLIGCGGTGKKAIYQRINYL